MGLLEEFAGGGQDDSDVDQAYDESFGPGRFAANAYGSRDFIPASSQPTGKAPPNQMADILRSVSGGKDMQGEEYYKGGRSTGRAQITNLQELGKVAKAVQGLPEELKTRVLSHLLGIPFESHQEVAYKNALKALAARTALGQPHQQNQERIAQERLDVSRESANRQQKNQQMQQLMNKFNMAYKITGREAQTENQKNHLQLQREGVKSNLVNSISRLTRDLQNMLPNDPQRTKTTKMILELQKSYADYNKFEDKLNPPPEGPDVGGGTGGSTTPPKTNGTDPAVKSLSERMGIRIE